MSKLLAKYIKKDLKENYNGDFVKYVMNLSAQDSINDFRDAVYACSSLTVKHFNEIFNNQNRYRTDKKIAGVLLCRALTHPGIKRHVVTKFKYKSVPITALYDKDAAQIVNSPSLYKYVCLPDTGWGAYRLREFYTARSSLEVLVPMLDCVSTSKHSGVDVMVNLIKMKPRIVECLRRRHLEELTDRNISYLFASINKPAVIKTVLSDNVTLDAEASKYAGEVFAMMEIAGEHVRKEAVHMIRLLR
jgi:hypothetical protein